MIKCLANSALVPLLRILDRVWFPRIPIVFCGAACGFIRTGCHLIMESVYVTIWPEHFQIGVFGFPSSHGWTHVDFFFLWVPCRALCMTPPLWFWPRGMNIRRCYCNPWNAKYFRICVLIIQWSQFRTLPVMLLFHNFLLLIFLCVIKCFILHLCCVFMSLYLVRVTFQPTHSYVIMAPQYILYLLSKYVQSIRGHPVHSRLQNVRNFMRVRCQACLTTSGRSLEHVLSYNLSIKCFLFHNCIVVSLLFLCFFFLLLETTVFFTLHCNLIPSRLHPLFI